MRVAVGHAVPVDGAAAAEAATATWYSSKDAAKMQAHVASAQAALAAMRSVRERRSPILATAEVTPMKALGVYGPRGSTTRSSLTWQSPSRPGMISRNTPQA